MNKQILKKKKGIIIISCKQILKLIFQDSNKIINFLNINLSCYFYFYFYYYFFNFIIFKINQKVGILQINNHWIRKKRTINNYINK